VGQDKQDILCSKTKKICKTPHSPRAGMAKPHGVGFQRGAGTTKKRANWPTTRLWPRSALPFSVGGRGVSAQFINLEKKVILRNHFFFKIAKLC